MLILAEFSLITDHFNAGHSTQMNSENRKLSSQILSSLIGFTIRSIPN